MIGLYHQEVSDCFSKRHGYWHDCHIFLQISENAVPFRLDSFFGPALHQCLRFDRSFGICKCWLAFSYSFFICQSRLCLLFCTVIHYYFYYYYHSFPPVIYGVYIVDERRKQSFRRISIYCFSRNSWWSCLLMMCWF